MKDQTHQVIDAYYDKCIANHKTSLEKKDGMEPMYEALIADLENAKLYTYTLVRDPLIKGCKTMVRHKRNEPRPLTGSEIRYNGMPWYLRLWYKIIGLV